MSHHAGWLYYLDNDGSYCEVINHQRLIGALGAQSLCGSGVQVLEQDCRWENGVLPFALDPCDLTSQLTFSATTWPGNPAPWWDGVPGSVSSQSYGFWIEEWTGLDGGHIKRSVAERAGRRGGANFGPLTSTHRVWKMNVLLVGENGAALEDLFRWLETTLMQCCDPCGGSDMLIRTTCPPDGQPSFGLYTVRGVGLLEGLTWETPPIERQACTLRRVSFTIGVSDPCLYSCATSCAEEETLPGSMDCVPFGIWSGCDVECGDMEDYRICCPVPAATRGTVSPVVTILNDSPNTGPPMRIYGMIDPLGIGCDPCSLPVCQDIITTRLPAGATLKIDSATRKVLFASPDTAGNFVDGTPFLLPAAGTAPQFLQLSCDEGWVAVEPAALCGDTSGLRISVDIVNRTGCC